MLVDFLRTLDFVSSRFDRDIRMRLRDDKSRYDYICTRVDDFKIVTKDPTIWIDMIATLFLINKHVPRSHCLGNDCTYQNGQDMCTYGVHMYVKEVVSRVERIYGCPPKEANPMQVSDYYPKLDNTPL